MGLTVNACNTWQMDVSLQGESCTYRQQKKHSQVYHHSTTIYFVIFAAANRVLYT